MTNADDIIEYGRSSGRDDELDPEDWDYDGDSDPNTLDEGHWCVN